MRAVSFRASSTAILLFIFAIIHSTEAALDVTTGHAAAVGRHALKFGTATGNAAISRRTNLPAERRTLQAKRQLGGLIPQLPGNPQPSSAAPSSVAPPISSPPVSPSGSSSSLPVTTPTNVITTPLTTISSSSSSLPTISISSISVPPTSTILTTSLPSTETTARPTSVSATNTSAVVIVVTRTLISTDANGSAVTSVDTATSALLPTSTSTSESSSESSSTGKIWGIVGGVVGGIGLLAAIIYIIWRCGQKRFSDLDDDVDDIKWPELQPDGQINSAATTTLNPLGTRRTGRAGIEMGEIGDDREGSEWGGDESYHTSANPSYEHVSYGDVGSNSYYDPYLGSSAAPMPAPQNIYPPAPYYGDRRQSQQSQSQDSHQMHHSYSQHSLPPAPLNSHPSANLGEYYEEEQER